MLAVDVPAPERGCSREGECCCSGLLLPPASPSHHSCLLPPASEPPPLPAPLPPPSLQGYFLLRESMLDSVIVARDKFLKPGGSLYPSHARMFMAPIRSNLWCVNQEGRACCGGHAAAGMHGQHQPHVPLPAGCEHAPASCAGGLHSCKPASFKPQTAQPVCAPPQPATAQRLPEQHGGVGGVPG